MKWTPKIFHNVLRLIVTCLGVLAILSSSSLALAQGDQEIVYDYVFLIDTSGSMNEGTPPLFGQVITVASDFINQLPNGSNLTIITFDTLIKEFGRWKNLTSLTKDSIVQSLSELRANGNYTAMWDAVCAGVSEMEAMNDGNNTHIQLLISYTDGEDNVSSNAPGACLERYLLLQKNGYTYWIYNSLNNIPVPSELLELQENLGINRSSNPTPIRVAQFQPFLLNMGNLLAGPSEPKQGCMVYWLSDPSITGMPISFSEPPTSDRSLPIGTGAQVCASGTTCDHQVIASTAQVCIDFDLVNLSPENLVAADYGEYTLSLPLEIKSDDGLGQVYIMPNKLDIRFSLEETSTATPIPTETKAPTSTFTPVPTDTPVPTNTSTPVPTSTPAMGTTNIRCQGKSEIDLGKLEINEDGSVSSRQDCLIEINSEYPTQPMLVSIESENVEILPYLSLEAGNITGKSVQVRPETKKITVLFNLPPEEVEKLKGGTHRYNADLVFVTQDTALIGDFKGGETTLPLAFQIVKPKSKLPLFIAGGVVALIALLGLIKGLAKRSTPPEFNLIMTVEDKNGKKDESLMLLKPVRIDKGKYKISVGSSPTAGVKVINLPQEAFDIIGVKSKEESMEYYIEPKAPMAQNGVPRQIQFKLLAGDELTIGATTLKFKIGM
ncbi:MAG TPA: hypothetical protein DD636_08575 [Anaerolineaceae bacterium]|jgi:hypothetical protein|nr:hypothetical protein [Anaerolineaceae bacterium]